jgi:hypothetical protein
MRMTPTMLSSPGLTGRSSKHRPWLLDCPVKPGNDTERISLTREYSSQDNSLQFGCDALTGRFSAPSRWAADPPLMRHLEARGFQDSAKIGNEFAGGSPAPVGGGTRT